jgi:HEAT repeat protein
MHMNSVTDILLHYAHREDVDRVDRCRDALSHSGNVVPALAGALTHPDDDVRVMAIQILGELGTQAEPALSDMIRFLTDPNRLVRICAARVVATFGTKAECAVPILETWLSCNDAVLQVIAAGHILMIDPSRADDLLPVLIEPLARNTNGVDCLAAGLLGSLGDLARPALPQLRQMLGHPDSSRRVAACEVICAITDDPSEAIHVGLDLLDDDDWLQRYVGAELLGSLGPRARSADARLRQALYDQDSAVCGAAREALAQIQ